MMHLDRYKKYVPLYVILSSIVLLNISKGLLLHWSSALKELMWVYARLLCNTWRATRRWVINKQLKSRKKQ